MVRNSSVIVRVSHLAMLSLGIGLVMTGVARAGDDDRTMSEKIMDSFYGTIRGTNMDNRGIDYRERSPLVVPPTLDLPPPAAAAPAETSNWPRDPDERQRKAIIAAKKKNAPPPARVQVTTAAGAAAAEAARPINIAPPTDAAQAPIPGTTRPAYASDRNGTALTDPIYDKPGDLFTGGASELADKLGMGNLFGTGKTSVVVEPGTEPAREALTQPPVGYQSPSPNYAYGEEKKGWLDGTSNPDRNPNAQKSSASSVAR